MITKPLPTHYIDTYFSINTDGMIFRTDRRNSNGSLDKDGYLILKIKGKQFKAHRVAYYLYHKIDILGVIDHIDKDILNNRECNLRDISQSLNAFYVTKQVNKDTGEIGIYLDKYTKGLLKKYTTRVGGKLHRFLTLEEAIKFKNK